MYDIYYVDWICVNVSIWRMPCIVSATLWSAFGGNTGWMKKDISDLFYRCDISKAFFPWWRHQMETFSALLAICAGNSPVPGEFPTQRPVTRSFDVYFDLRPNKWLSKQSWGWWFETLSCSLWRHRNALSGHKISRGLKIIIVRFGVEIAVLPWNWTGARQISKLLVSSQPLPRGFEILNMVAIR